MVSAQYRLRGRQTGTVLAIVVAGAGCAGSWRPSLEAVRVTATTGEFRVASYLPARADDERLYHRSSPGANPAVAPVEYRRISTPASVLEGRLVGRPVPPLFDCLTGGDDDAKPRAAALNAFLHGGPGWGFLFEPAVPVFPETVVVGRTVEAAARVTCVHRTGRRLFDGTITRRVTAEGIETVATPAGVFENCLRLRVEMALRLHWGPSTDTTEYIWLAPGTGEVRRIERFTGAFWFLFFATTAEYALVTPHAAAAPDNAAPAPTPPAVRCSALLLDRLGPSPILTGLYYEFAPPEMQRAEWHAVREPNPGTTERLHEKPSAGEGRGGRGACRAGAHTPSWYGSAASGSEPRGASPRPCHRACARCSDDSKSRNPATPILRSVRVLSRRQEFGATANQAARQPSP